MKFIYFLLSYVILCNSQNVGEVKETTSEKYFFNSPTSDSDSASEEIDDSKYPTFSYQEDSFEDLTSHEDPLLIPPRQAFYNGPWDIQRQEISISGLSNLNTFHRDYPIQIPHIPNFVPIVPYPSYNSRSLQNDGYLPSTYASISSENIETDHVDSKDHIN